ncbi:FAD:protein FMN transferase [candidate division KSB1 bacterium]|nr:FAD:protein FMN transferase [candidate division KSB1 bacterium]
MGTTYTVKTILGSEQIQSDVQSILNRMDSAMSTYQENSFISRFNRSNGNDWFPVSEDVVRVVYCAQRIAAQSGGAFDITVGSLVNLWGFGPGERSTKVVHQEKIRRLQKDVGYHHIDVQLNPPCLKKFLGGVNIDLSAIAKGYAVDKVAEYLDSLKIANFYIEVGGEIRVRGRNPDRKEWQIGISTPDELGGIQKIISLSEKSVATSGDYHNYYEREGVRYSHTIDPRTGRPIMHKLASVTVVHDSCMVADAWATAITVLGPEEGYNLALRNDLAVFMIIRDKNGFIEKKTQQFNDFLEE